MVYKRVHWLLNMSGPLFGVERWSMGLRLTPNFGPNDQAGQQALCDAYAAVVANWVTTAGVLGAQAKLDLVKFNLIGIDGRYQESWSNFTEYATPVAASVSTAMPPQIALAVGLRTAATRGLAARGRIYIPAPQIGIETSTGRMPTSGPTFFAGKVKDLINSLNAVEPGRRVVVCSNVGAGEEREVTAVECGRVLDTMRSRRTKFEEDRVQSAVAAAPA